MKKIILSLIAIISLAGLCFFWPLLKQPTEKLKKLPYSGDLKVIRIGTNGKEIWAVAVEKEKKHTGNSYLVKWDDGKKDWIKKAPFEYGLFRLGEGTGPYGGKIAVSSKGNVFILPEGIEKEKPLFKFANDKLEKIYDFAKEKRENAIDNMVMTNNDKLFILRWEWTKDDDDKYKKRNTTIEFWDEGSWKKFEAPIDNNTNRLSTGKDGSLHIVKNFKLKSKDETISADGTGFFVLDKQKRIWNLLGTVGPGTHIQKISAVEKNNLWLLTNYSPKGTRKWKPSDNGRLYLWDGERLQKKIAFPRNISPQDIIATPSTVFIVDIKGNVYRYDYDILEEKEYISSKKHKTFASRVKPK